MKKTLKPYLLLMGGNQVGFFKTEQLAMAEATTINTNAVRSGGSEKYRKRIKIVYDQVGENQQTICEC